MISAAVILRDGKFLMVKQQKHGRIFWNFPGGHVEDGESPEQACIREVKEETGLDVSIEKKLAQSGDSHFFLVHITGGNLKKEEGLLDIRWISPEGQDQFDTKMKQKMELILQSLGNEKLLH